MLSGEMCRHFSSCLSGPVIQPLLVNSRTSFTEEDFVRSQFIFALILQLAIPALADTVVLKNGDRLTGSIAKSDGKTLVLKTDYAGDLTIKFDAIQSLTSTADMNVTLGGKTAVGPVSTTGDQLVIATKAAGSVEAPMASLSVMRSPAEEAAYQKSLHPGWSEGWNGGANLGFAITAGNSETKNLNIAFNATRAGQRDKLTLYENTVYAVSSKLNRQPISPSQTTANANGGGIRYDRDFLPHVFGFGSAEFFANALQDLDLRTIVSGGMGYHAIKNPATTLDLLAGLSWTHENFSGVLNPNPPPSCETGTEPSCFYSPSDSAASLTLGDNFMHKLGKSTVLTQSFLIYPGLSSTKIVLPNNLSENVHEYRFALNLGTVTKLNKWLGWQNSFADVFVSNPPTVPAGTPRIERNDIQLSTGLNISFSH